MSVEVDAGGKAYQTHPHPARQTNRLFGGRAPPEAAQAPKLNAVKHLLP